jgi:hypothetical protein
LSHVQTQLKTLRWQRMKASTKFALKEPQAKPQRGDIIVAPGFNPAPANGMRPRARKKSMDVPWMFGA